MADLMQPTAKFCELDGKTYNLAQIAGEIRHNVEIRNRSSYKRLQNNR